MVQAPWKEWESYFIPYDTIRAVRRIMLRRGTDVLFFELKGGTLIIQVILPETGKVLRNFDHRPQEWFRI